MFIRRKSTKFNELADYYMSTKPIKTCTYEIFTEPKHKFYEDLKLTNDIIILRMEDVEQHLGIKLNGLEQIEI